MKTHYWKNAIMVFNILHANFKNKINDSFQNADYWSVPRRIRSVALGKRPTNFDLRWLPNR